MRRTLLSLLVILLLAGCTGLPRTGNTGSTDPSADTTPTASAAYPSEMSTAARIQSRGEIIVGVRYDLEPFSFISSEEGDLSGLEIDLAHELARRWLGDPNAVHFRQVRTDTALSHIQNSDIDFALAGIVHTQQVEASGDFGPDYFVNGQALLAYPELGIQSLNDLTNRRVGLLSWTKSGQTLAAAATEISPTYSSYENFFQVVDALRTRQIDVYADQRHRLERGRRLVNGTIIIGQYTREPYSLLYRSNDPDFSNLVLLTFQDMRLDGTLDQLYSKWLPGTPLPSFYQLPGSAVPPTLAQSSPTLATLNVEERIRQRGKLSVGYIQGLWPYSGDRDDGVQTGFEVRLAMRLAERWLGNREAITFVPVTRETGPQKLDSGEVDLLVGAWTPNRPGELKYDYSIPINNDGVGILSLTMAPINSLTELSGKSVGVIAGSAGAAAVPELSQAGGIGLSPMTYPDVPTAISALQNGQISAILAERILVLDPLYNTPGLTLTDARFTNRPICFVLPQGDSAYRDLVNLTLMWLQADGSYAELYHTWFDDPAVTLESWPGNSAVPLNLQVAP